MTLLVGSIFHMTCKIVSEMTYNVSMGTLNPTIPYQVVTSTNDCSNKPVESQNGDVNDHMEYGRVEHYENDRLTGFMCFLICSMLV